MKQCKQHSVTVTILLGWEYVNLKRFNLIIYLFMLENPWCQWTLGFSTCSLLAMHTLFAMLNSDPWQLDCILLFLLLITGNWLKYVNSASAPPHFWSFFCSCLPNSVLVFEGRLAVVRAVEHIPKGTEVICVSLVSSF